MAERTYYVICDDNCKFEGMTKEQIFAAIAEATGATPTDIDSAFITKVKEINKNATVQFWKGTQAEYNALTEKSANVVYIIDDDSALDDLKTYIDTKIAEINSGATILETGETSDGWNFRKYSDGTVDLWGMFSPTFTAGDYYVDETTSIKGGDTKIALPDFASSYSIKYANAIFGYASANHFFEVRAVSPATNYDDGITYITIVAHSANKETITGKKVLYVQVKLK